MENKSSCNASQHNISMTIENIDTMTNIGFKNSLIHLLKTRYPDVESIDIRYRTYKNDAKDIEIQVVY
jgi:hypothetical protein